MKIKFARGVGLSAVIVLAGLGLSACASPVIPTDQKVISDNPTKKVTKEVSNEKVHRVGDVAATVDGFFSTLSSETEAAVAQSIRDGDAGMSGEISEEQAQQILRDTYPKTFEFLSSDMAPDKASQLVGTFSLTFMFMKVEITADETGVKLDGDNASIRGDFLKMKMAGERLPPDPNSNPGTIFLKYVGDKWVISDFDLGADAEALIEESFEGDPGYEELPYEEISVDEEYSL